MNSDRIASGKGNRKRFAEAICIQSIRIKESDFIRGKIQLNAIMSQDIHAQSDRVTPQVIGEHFRSREQRSVAQIKFGRQIHPIGSPVSDHTLPGVRVQAVPQLWLQSSIQKRYRAALSSMHFSSSPLSR